MRKETKETAGDTNEEYQGEQADCIKICSFEDKQLEDRGEDRLRLEQMIVNVK